MNLIWIDFMDKNQIYGIREIYFCLIKLEGSSHWLIWEEKLPKAASPPLYATWEAFNEISLFCYVSGYVDFEILS